MMANRYCACILHPHNGEVVDYHVLVGIMDFLLSGGLSKGISQLLQVLVRSSIFERQMFLLRWKLKGVAWLLTLNKFNIE